MDSEFGKRKESHCAEKPKICQKTTLSYRSLNADDYGDIMDLSDSTNGEIKELNRVRVTGRIGHIESTNVKRSMQKTSP